MTNKVLYSDEIGPITASMEQRRAAIKSELKDYPVDLGICDSVVYNDKRNCYTAKFGTYGTSSKNVVLVQDVVAVFLLAHAFTSGALPIVHAHFIEEEGVVDAVCLMFMSRG